MTTGWRLAAVTSPFVSPVSSVSPKRPAPPAWSQKGSATSSFNIFNGIERFKSLRRLRPRERQLREEIPAF